MTKDYTGIEKLGGSAMKRVKWENPLFHVTLASNLPSIMRDGLLKKYDSYLADGKQGVYLCSEMNVLATAYQIPGEKAMLEVNLPDTWTLYADPNVYYDTKEWCLVSKRNIPARYLRVIANWDGDSR